MRAYQEVRNVSFLENLSTYYMNYPTSKFQGLIIFYVLKRRDQAVKNNN